ncbi:ribosome recycling factor [Francisellaceae bacterium]|nr:ribosome recycling factor [Francisellaceae bacterium]
MINDIIKDADDRMQKSLESLKHDLSKIRTGRAHPDLLASLSIDYYGTDTPINQLANISVLDARTLSVSPWEKNLVNAVDKAIINSGLGLNPVNLGDTLRVPLPPLTEETRKEMTKMVKSETEKGRISIRNIRRDANSMFKDLLKDKEISEDEQRKSEEKIQVLTNKAISIADQLAVEKEKDLMSI